jgi:PucR-like helix-turn-helix protein
MGVPLLKLVAEPARATLASLCEDVRVLDVVLAPGGLDVPVAGVCIHDPFDGAAAARGDVVLAPGAPAREQATDNLLAAVREAGAAAVVLRRRRPLSGWLLEAFADAGVALLAAPSGLPWADLHVLVVAALDAGGERPAGGLAGLADATAAVAGGPITIEDLEGRVLAFSAGGQEIDDARAATVLGRRVPDRWRRELRRTGALDRIVRSHDVVRVDLPGLAPRRAVAIRGAGATLGVIWLAGDAMPAADEALRQAARAAALQLTRDGAEENLDRRTRTGALRMLLAGEGAPAPLLDALGLPAAGELAVVAVRDDGAPRGAAPRDAASPRDLCRHADLLAAHLRADHLAAAAGVVDGRVYALVALGDESSLRRAVADWLRRCGAELRAGLGVDGDIAAARRAADRCIELSDRAGELVAYDDVHGRALLADVAALLDGVSPALRALLDYDDERGTDYIATLRAFLDVHGDAGRTASALKIHVNTLRYRMRRLGEIAKLDLDDPEARLAVALELHALGQRRAAPGVTSPIS